MKVLSLIALFLGIFTNSIAQVGIGTASPDNSAMLEVSSTNKGMLFPRMTSTERLGITNPSKGLHVFDTISNSLWFFNWLNWINYATQAQFGDIKSGIQASDHEGWVKLDGRAISGLSVTQRSVALSLLGSSATLLPNATEAYAVQKTGTLGSVSGSNTVAITQANLPNVSFSGTAANAGSHTHTVDPVNTNTTSNGSHAHSIGRRGNPDAGAYDPGDSKRWENSAATTDRTYYGAFATSSDGNHAHSVDIPATTSTSNGDHGHNVTVSSGGSGTALNIAPKSLIVNMFIYLGL